MKSKIILSIIPMLFLTNSLKAFDLEYKLNKIEKKLNKLEKISKEYKELKEDYLEDLDDTEETLNKLETNTAMNSKVRFGIDFDTTYNNMSVTNANSKEYKLDNFYRSKVKLEMNSKIAKEMSFDGELAMYKNWADNTPNYSSYYDTVIGKRPTNSTMYLTRAYVNWKLPKIIDNTELVMTIGRQPSSSGSTYEYSNNRTRQGTCSAIVSDGNMDGLVLTIKTDNITGLKNSSIRLAYGKSYQYDEVNMFDNISIPTAPNINDSNVIVIFGEAQLPDFLHTGIKNIKTQLSYIKAFDIVADTTGQLASMTGLPENTPNVNIGDIELYSGLIMLDRIYDSKWDIFANMAFSKATPVASFGNTIGLLSDGVDYTIKEGQAIWIGTRYNFDNGMKLGIEYNSGDKNWISFSQGSDNIYNKLAVRGDVMEIYSIIPINRKSHIKIGVLSMDYKYTGSASYLGEAKLIETLPEAQKAEQIDKVLNYYISFKVHF